jgi:TPR repeat protein
VALEALADDIGVELTDEALGLIQLADKGQAEAQTDIAILFMESGLSGKAVYWLRAAAEQGYGDAMHLLGKCYLSGQGVDRDEREGLSWIRRAATGGHLIACAQMQALSGT